MCVLVWVYLCVGVFVCVWVGVEVKNRCKHGWYNCDWISAKWTCWETDFV